MNKLLQSIETRCCKHKQNYWRYLLRTFE